MIVSLNWLSALLGRDLAAKDVADRLTMLGAPVEAEEELRPQLDDVVIGLVERAEQHPNADRLTLCHVNNGQEVVEVVCGAPNVKPGAKYPYAAEGAVLPAGFTLEARTGPSPARMRPVRVGTITASGSEASTAAASGSGWAAGLRAGASTPARFS